MCFGGGGDNGAAQAAQAQAAKEAAEARQRELQRSTRLRYGSDLINQAFDGRAADAKMLDLSSLSGARRSTDMPAPYGGGSGYGERGNNRDEDRGGNAGRYSLADGYYATMTPDNGTQRGWGVYNANGDMVFYNDTLEGLAGQKYYYGGNAANGRVGGVGDAYYSGVRDNVTALGQADLFEQSRKARENLLYSLGRAGLVTSSVGNQAQADLAQKNADATGKIELQSRDAVNKVKQGVEQERASAISQLYATENPDIAANSAITKSALILQDKPDYNPLGDIFAGLGQGIGTLTTGIKRSQLTGSGGAGGVNVAGYGDASARIVGG